MFLRNYYDEFGNSFPYKVCHFVFDQLLLSGDLNIQVVGDASLSIEVAGNGYIGSSFNISGQGGGKETAPLPGPGGFAGGAVNARGEGPGGGSSSSSPGGAGHGGTGSHPNQNSGRSYGDGKISNLLGGSGGGGYVVDASGGSGGGAISIEANGSSPSILLFRPQEEMVVAEVREDQAAQFVFLQLIYCLRKTHFLMFQEEETAVLEEEYF